MAKIKLGKDEYDLSTKLRVAYLVQKAHNHKPYAEIFQQINQMTLEQQIEIIYISFKVENPKAAEEMNLQQFQSILFEESNISYISQAIGEIIEGIMFHGMAPEEIERKKKESLEED